MVNEVSDGSPTGPPDKPLWYRIAFRARPLLDAVPRGERGPRSRKIAHDHGVNSEDTLRRYVAAASFWDRFFREVRSDVPTFPATTPVAAVELIARWYAYDRAAAKKAAIKLARGQYTVFQLRAEERNARLSQTTLRKGRAGKHQLRQGLADKVHALIRSETREEYVLDHPRDFEPTKVDFLFRSKARAADRVAVVIFGPFRDRGTYADKAEDFILKVLGLSRCYQRVMGVLPEPVPGIDFEAWAKHFAEHVVTFYYLDPLTNNLRPAQSVENDTDGDEFHLR